MNILELLTMLNIKYEIVEHEPVFTVEQAEFVKGLISGVGCKNLFMKNKNKDYFLIIVDDCKKADMKNIKKVCGTSHLSFASEEELNNILGLKRGSVSPFGIINDKKNKVRIIIDKDLKGKRLLFHPNINTATISIDYNDLIKFIEYENHKYFYMEDNQNEK